jgi:hypothetical protein
MLKMSQKSFQGELLRKVKIDPIKRDEKNDT